MSNTRSKKYSILLRERDFNAYRAMKFINKNVNTVNPVTATQRILERNRSLSPFGSRVGRLADRNAGSYIDLWGDLSKRDNNENTLKEYGTNKSLYREYKAYGNTPIRSNRSFNSENVKTALDQSGYDIM
jgi:hypothetical protein